MNLNMSFKQIDSSEAIKHYTREKCQPLEKYFEGRFHATWTFSKEHLLLVAHCHLVGNHMDYFGQAENESLHAAIDLVVDKIERQIRKHKEVVTDHLHRNGRRAATE